MGCINWKRYFDDEDQYAVAVLKDDTIVGHIPKRYLESVLCL